MNYQTPHLSDVASSAIFRPMPQVRFDAASLGPARESDGVGNPLPGAQPRSLCDYINYQWRSNPINPAY